MRTRTTFYTFLGLLIFNAHCFGSTLGDVLGSSDKREYEISNLTLGAALIEINGKVKVSAFEPIQMMKKIWADPAQNDFPVVDMSHEYLLFRLGAKALYTFSHYVENFSEARELSRFYREYQAQAEPFLHFIHPWDRKEMDCMNVNWSKNSCPDAFQNGLQENEVACMEGLQYLACHLRCRENSGVQLHYEIGLCGNSLK